MTRLQGFMTLQKGIRYHRKEIYGLPAGVYDRINKVYSTKEGVNDTSKGRYYTIGGVSSLTCGGMWHNEWVL